MGGQIFSLVPYRFMWFMKVIGAALFAAAFASGPAASAHDLTVVVDGVRNERGVIGVLVFSSAEGWPENVSSAYASMSAPARMPKTELTFHGLPDGDYAVVVLHDENENEKLDRNWIGKPKEQWGMSNNPPAVLSAPSFDRARFRLGKDERLLIQLR